MSADRGGVRLPSISPGRPAQAGGKISSEQGGWERVRSVVSTKAFERAESTATNKQWAAMLVGADDINACAYRVATPLALTYSAPIAYESEIGRRALDNRKRRATVRRMALAYETGLLADVLSAWFAVAKQGALASAKFDRVRAIFGHAFGNPLAPFWEAWAHQVQHFKLVRSKLGNFARWLFVRELAAPFCKWQILWAGCADTRPLRTHALRMVDYQRERTERFQMDKFMASTRGRAYLLGCYNMAEEMFFESCRQQCLDLETLGEYTVEELQSKKGAGLLDFQAQGLYNKVQVLLQPNHGRIESILNFNPVCHVFLTSLAPLIEEFREMVRRGEHPMGKTSEEMRAEIHLQKVKKDYGDLADARGLALETCGHHQVLVDCRIKLSEHSKECPHKLQIPAQDLPSAPGWARGYVLEFPDRMIGDLDLQEVWVDLLLPDDAAAFIFVADSKEQTGRPLYRSTNTEKGKGMVEMQYRFHMPSPCAVSSHHAIMVHVTARNVPSRYLHWKDFRQIRKMNELLTVRPVECPKDLKINPSDKHLSMQLAFKKIAGQEELEVDKVRRRTWLRESESTPLTPQTGETDRSKSDAGTNSRPGTNRPRTGTGSRQGTGGSKAGTDKPGTGRLGVGRPDTGGVWFADDGVEKDPGSLENGHNALDMQTSLPFPMKKANASKELFAFAPHSQNESFDTASSPLHFTNRQDADELHEQRKGLQSSKSVRFYNEEQEQGASTRPDSSEGRQRGKAKELGKDKHGVIGGRRSSRKKTQLSRTRYFHGSRNMSRDMRTVVHANCACVFNPVFNEFWVMEDFPSPWIVAMDYEGRVLRRIENFQDFSPNCMTIDLVGNLYASDNDFSFFKFSHHRFFDGVARVSTDRLTRQWEFRNTELQRKLVERNTRASGVAIDAKNPEILYCAFNKGPILMINSTGGGLLGQIEPDPPFVCVSSLCCCSDVLVVGDSHQVKVFDLRGHQISVLGQLYTYPCLVWTGLDLYVGEKGSFSWHCYQPKVASGVELSRQHERVFRGKSMWSEQREGRQTPVTPNTQAKIRQIKREVEKHMDLQRPLSRALGDSSRLALHQGLEYYDFKDKTYKVGKFFSEHDRGIRDEISQLKVEHPELPVDAGNLYRAY